MPSSEHNNLNRIEELKRKLSSKDYETPVGRYSTFSHFKDVAVPESWSQGKEAVRSFGGKFFAETTLFKKFFIFSLCFFVFVVGYALFTFLNEGNTVSNENIDIAILGNAFTAGGEELSLQIGITNKNNSALELVDLLIEYPKSSPSGLSGEVERIRESLGTIAAGGIKNENIKLILFGEQGSTNTIKIAIEYRVEGSNAIFIKEQFYEVNINSTPIDLSVEAPETASSNQEIELDIKTTLNATRPAEKILLRVDYPSSFQFISAEPEPSFNNNTWDLGDLPPGTDREISIRGKMLDVFDGEEKTFRVWSGSQSATDKHSIGIVYNSLAQTVVIRKPLIDVELLINGQSGRDYTSHANSQISGEIRFTNNLDTRVDNLEIRAKISGNAVNEKTISARQGFYNSSSDTIVWDRNTIGSFREISSGERGSVSFSLSPLALFSAGGLLNSPTIKIEVEVVGKHTMEGYETDNLSSRESSTIRIISEAGLAGKALYYSGPFSNTGPIPPKAETKTSYTIVWSLSNTSNNVSGAIVRASLPSWVSFANRVSPQDEDVTFNSTTREVIWDVGNIPRGTGFTTPGKEVSFIVELNPSISQIGSAPVLINDAVLTAKDDFANVNLRVNKASLNTRLVNDPAFPPNGDRVVE